MQLCIYVNVPRSVLGQGAISGVGVTGRRGGWGGSLWCTPSHLSLSHSLAGDNFFLS